MHETSTSSVLKGKALARRTLLASILLICAMFWLPGVIAAQDTPTPGSPITCAQLLPAVQKNLADRCNGIDRDQICYGNPSINVEYQSPDQQSSTPFTAPGNIAPINTFKSINTAPLNLEHGEWGLAVIKAQTNLPGASAGQAVTFVLYGDTSLTNVTPGAAGAPATAAATAPACSATTMRQTFLRGGPGPNEQQVQLLPPNTTVKLTGRLANGTWVKAEAQGQTGWVFTQTIKPGCDVNTLPVNDPTAPAALPGMSAFYFSSGVSNDAACKDIPPGGLLVQSPKGQKVSFRVNGADITIGSTVIFRAQANQEMVMSVLEGQGIVDTPGGKRVVNAGQGVSIPLGNAGRGNSSGPAGLNAVGTPGPVRPMQAKELFIPTLCQFAKSASLIIPCSIATPPPPKTPTPVPAATATTQQTSGVACTFTVQRFSADQNPVPPNYTSTNGGQYCTKLHWDVEGSETLYLNGSGVVGHGSRDVCIQKPTTFTLTMNCGGQSKSVSLTLNPLAG